MSLSKRKIPIDDQHLADLLDHIQNEAVGVIFTDSEPSDDEVPEGKIVIHDDGEGTKQIHFRTGQDNTGTVSLGDELVIENRTSDPSSPETGRIWIRTDL